MMILDTTSKKLQVVLSGAITTNQLHVNAAWADTQSGDTFVPGHNDLLTNSATPIDIVAAPAADTQRQVKELTVFNNDTVAATVTVQTVDGANTRKHISVTLQSGENLFFAAGQWGVLATNGAIKGSAGVSSVALTMPSDFAVAGSPITTTGTLAVTANNQSANTFKAGPTTGAAAAPTYRALVAADLNSLALTSGGVVFGSSGGGLAQDASNAFWDATNHRLGIGTTVPIRALTIDTSGVVNSVVGSAGNGLAVLAGSIQLVGQNANGSLVAGRVSGTLAVPTAITTFLILGRQSFTGFDGSAYGATTGAVQGRSSENWSSTAHGTRVEFAVTPNGSVTLGTACIIYEDNRFQANGALVDLSYSKQVPLTGFAITGSDVSMTLILEPAGVLAAGTVTMPAAPKDGQRFNFTCTQNITALTIQANAGQTLRAGLAAVAYLADTPYSWQYALSTTTWYRIT